MKLVRLFFLPVLLLAGCGQRETTPAPAPSPAASGNAERSLAEARRGFKTKLIRRESANVPVPQPPLNLFRIVRYDSSVGQLAALLSPDPNDGKKHPAIIWITSGDCNTIDDGIWKTLPADFDQTSRAAKAFRKGGLVLMFPTLRGGNDNPGFKEGLFGEVDDVLAAAEFLAKQPFVDPQRIYLGGLSTGGTLVLLTAASSDRFRAVFAFGPADVVTDHSPEYLPFDRTDSREVALRSPIKWLQSIRPPAFVFEGVTNGNVKALLAMKRASTIAKLHFYLVQRAGHVTILGPVAEIIAGKIAREDGPATNLAFTEDELNRAFAN
jgi:alpha/beta superfamily hydrolase